MTGTVKSADLRKGKLVSGQGMLLVIGPEHREKSRVRNHEGDLKDILVIGLGISRGLASDSRSFREDRVPGSTMTIIGEGIRSLEVELLMRKMTTQIEGHENGMLSTNMMKGLL